MADKGVITMTTGEAAAALDVPSKVVRRYVRSRKIPTKKKLGAGPEIHIIVPAYLAQLRKDGYEEDAQSIEAWLSRQSAGRLNES